MGDNVLTDPRCVELARYFLSDEVALGKSPKVFECEGSALASAIQVAIENWFQARDEPPDSIEGHGLL